MDDISLILRLKMSLRKILAPLLSQSRRLQEKQHGILLPPVLSMSPRSNNPYNNMIGLATEEAFVESVEDPATETAMILHEKPTPFDMCDNDLLIESCHDNEQPDQKETDPMPIIKTTTTTTTTTYQSFGPSTCSLTDGGNETLVEIMPDAQDVEERIMPATPPMGCCTTPRLIKEECSFVDTKNQQQELAENPLKPASIDHSTEIQMIRDDDAEEIHHDIKKYTEELNENPQDKVAIEELKDEEQEFTQPLQAVCTMHRDDLFDEPQEPDFKMKTNFKNTLNREGSLKSKCMKLIRGMKYRPSQKKENSMKTAFSEASADGGHIDTNLARSVSTISIINEETSTPICRRNIADSFIRKSTKTEPLAPYISPKLGSAAYDIKVLCDQKFFGLY